VVELIGLRAGEKGAAKAAPGNLKRMGVIVEDSAARPDQAFARHPVARPYPALAAADLAWVAGDPAQSNAPVGNSFSIGSAAAVRNFSYSAASAC
jgi:hypothetical protein